VDVLNAITLVGGLTIGILSAGATFFNKKRYTEFISTLQAGNDELRNQNKDLRDERIDLTGQLAACKARDEEKERLIDNFKAQPNLTHLTKLISNNHKEVMEALLSGKKRR
jgi:hypothetical protein